MHLCVSLYALSYAHSNCVAIAQSVNDPWNAVNASGHFRKCKQAAIADELRASIPSERQKAPKLRSAIASTHGGVMRDLKRLDDDLRLGNQAHTSTPKDFSPCAPFGAIKSQLLTRALRHW